MRLGACRCAHFVPGNMNVLPRMCLGTQVLVSIFKCMHMTTSTEHSQTNLRHINRARRRCGGFYRWVAECEPLRLIRIREWRDLVYAQWHLFRWYGTHKVSVSHLGKVTAKVDKSSLMSHALGKQMLLGWDGIWLAETWPTDRYTWTSGFWLLEHVRWLSFSIQTSILHSLSLSLKGTPEI